MAELFWSLTHRPYVTLFLVAFLAFSWLEQGKLRTLVWLVSGYLVALAAEWGSINYGIPFGYYVYHREALKNDLLVAGVPFFDSVSFAFLSYVSFSFAQFFLSPLWARGLDIQRVTSRRARNSASVLLLGSCLMVVIDVVVDPAAIHGKHWFLGDIYHYPVPGDHFGVPMANYAGWLVVAWVTILLNQRFDAWLARREIRLDRTPALPYVPAKGLFAPLFWTGIIAFELGITAWLGWSYDLSGVAEPARKEWQSELRTQFLSSLFVALPIVVIAALQLFRPAGQADGAMVDEWLSEYPCPALAKRRAT